MAIRPEPTFAQGPFNLDPFTASVQIKWYRYITAMASPFYAFDLFEDLAGWASSGTGTSALAPPLLGETWSENDSLLQLSCNPGQTAKVTGDGVLAAAVAGTRHCFEFVVDTRRLQTAELEIRCTVTNNIFRLMLKGTKMYVWSDALASPPGYIGWDLVYDELESPPLGHGVYKFRFNIISVTTQTSLCMGYWASIQSNKWKPLVTLSFGGGSKMPAYCDYPWNPAQPLPAMGTVSIELRNTDVVPTDIMVDHVKLFSWNSTAQLPPWDGVLGEPAFHHYEVHGSLTNNFTPDFAGGTTQLLSMPASQWNPTFNVTVPGLQKGKVNYLKVLCVQEDPVTPGIYYWSESNQIEVRVPEQRFSFLFAAIRGARTRAAYLFNRTVTKRISNSFLFTKIVKGDKMKSFLFASVRGIRKRSAFLFAGVRSSRLRPLFLFGRTVAKRISGSFLFAGVTGIRRSFLFMRVVQIGTRPIFLFAKPAKKRRRPLFLMAAVAETGPFTQHKHEQYKRLMVSVQWAQQLHGDINS